MSSASRLPPNSLPSSMTLAKSSAFRAFNAMTFSSIVSLDEAVHHDVPGLPDPVGPVDRLRLGGRVPPRVEQEAVVGFGQVQPEPAGLEADQEHRVRAVLEAPQHRGPVPRLAVQVAIPDAGRVEPLADVGEEPGELAEDESTVPACGYILDLIEQRVD